MQSHFIPTPASTPFHSLVNTFLRSVSDQHSFRHAIWTHCFPLMYTTYIYIYIIDLHVPGFPIALPGQNPTTLRLAFRVMSFPAAQKLPEKPFTYVLAESPVLNPYEEVVNSRLHMFLNLFLCKMYCEKSRRFPLLI